MSLLREFTAILDAVLRDVDDSTFQRAVGRLMRRLEGYSGVSGKRKAVRPLLANLETFEPGGLLQEQRKVVIATWLRSEARLAQPGSKPPAIGRPKKANSGVLAEKQARQAKRREHIRELHARGITPADMQPELFELMGEVAQVSTIKNDHHAMGLKAHRPPDYHRQHKKPGVKRSDVVRERRRRVAELKAAGKLAREIAAELGITEQTVHDDWRRIREGASK